MKKVIFSGDAGEDIGANFFINNAFVVIHLKKVILSSDAGKDIDADFFINNAFVVDTLEKSHFLRRCRRNIRLISTN